MQETNTIRALTGSFKLVGTLKNVRNELRTSQNGYEYRLFSATVDCGEYGDINVDCISGKKKTIYVTTVDGNQKQIAWEDRFKDENLTGLYQNCYFKSDNGTFLTAYDGLDGLNIEGNLVEVQGHTEFDSFSAKDNGAKKTSIKYVVESIITVSGKEPTATFRQRALVGKTPVEDNKITIIVPTRKWISAEKKSVTIAYTYNMAVNPEAKFSSGQLVSDFLNNAHTYSKNQNVYIKTDITGIISNTLETVKPTASTDNVVNMNLLEALTKGNLPMDEMATSTTGVSRKVMTINGVRNAAQIDVVDKALIDSCIEIVDVVSEGKIENVVKNSASSVIADSNIDDDLPF